MYGFMSIRIIVFGCFTLQTGHISIFVIHFFYHDCFQLIFAHVILYYSPVVPNEVEILYICLFRIVKQGGYTVQQHKNNIILLTSLPGSPTGPVAPSAPVSPCYTERMHANYFQI